MPSAVATAFATFRWVLLVATMLGTVRAKGQAGSIDATRRAADDAPLWHKQRDKNNTIPETPLRINAVRKATSNAFGDNLRNESRKAVYVASSDSK